MSDCRKCADFEWCMEYEECGLFKPKIMTKADEIRALTDEELAGVIKNPCDMGLHIPNEWCKKRNCGYQCSLDWLKQEASDET